MKSNIYVYKITHMDTDTATHTHPQKNEDYISHKLMKDGMEDRILM